MKLSINTVVTQAFREKNLFIKYRNSRDERNYFSENWFRFPNGNIIKGKSYDDIIDHYISLLKGLSTENYYVIFKDLRDYFFFSAGCDMMFKKKLEADSYIAPMIPSFIFPIINKYVDTFYNGIEIDSASDDYDSKMEVVKKNISLFSSVQKLVYMLYCEDFYFTDKIKKHFSTSLSTLCGLLNDYDITVGMFLDSLIDYKCDTIFSVFKYLPDGDEKDKYMKMINDLRDEKHKEVKKIYNYDLPITYFYDHTMSDYIKSGGEKNKTFIKKNID